MPSKKTLSLDFDGVCHKYLTPWIDAWTIPDGPVEGLYNFLLRVDEYFVVEVYSTRSEIAAGRLAMAAWFQRNARDYANVCALSVDDYNHLMDVVDRIRFPSHKPKAFVGLDDRILTFEGAWPSPEVLLGWKPWNKRTVPPPYTHLAIPTKFIEPLRKLAESGSTNPSGGEDKRLMAEMVEWLRAEMRRV